MSTQKCSSNDDLNPKDLDVIFSSLTKDTSDSSATLDIIPKKKCHSRFVNNSGIVPYKNSSTSSDSDDTVDVIHDSPPDSPVFKCVPRPDKQSNSQETSRFKTPTSKEELCALAGKSFAHSTDRKINWAVNLFRS